jgi:hypothetical protein
MPPRLCIKFGIRNDPCSDGGHAVPGKSRCRAHGGGAWARVNPALPERYLREHLNAGGARTRTACAAVLREAGVKLRNDVVSKVWHEVTS